MHRVGAIAVALVVLVFGVLGFAGGLDFFSTSGEPILGMSSNGLLSTIFVLTAAVLIGAAVRGARIASTVMIVVGLLFLLALVHLAVLRTDFNVLAFEMTNVFFSIGAGLTLLVLGAYGRISGHLPPDSLYACPMPARTWYRLSPTRRPRRSPPPSGRCGRRRSRWSTTSPRPSSGAASRRWLTSAPAPLPPGVDGVRRAR